MPLHLAPLALLALLLAACSTPERASGSPDATPADATPPEASIVGTWELVAQEGYPEGQELEQRRLTFYDDGRMVFATVVGGQATEQEMQYRLEGDRLVTATGVGGPAARASRYSLDGDRLVIEQPETGQRDVYRRVR
ncbi:MAG TPA: lipocalin family protein [Rubricoccaceae bacterium]|nr:lipocalin family protein [Rubricoccaceae bacterium]